MRRKQDTGYMNKEKKEEEKVRKRVNVCASVRVATMYVERRMRRRVGGGAAVVIRGELEVGDGSRPGAAAQHQQMMAVQDIGLTSILRYCVKGRWLSAKSHTQLLLRSRSSSSSSQLLLVEQNRSAGEEAAQKGHGGVECRCWR